MVSCIIVDDDNDFTEIFSDFLINSGLKVYSICPDGKKAVNVYEKYKPDVVFVDLIMPKYDGVYAINNIRNKHPDAKIIVVTANNSVDKSYVLDTLNVNQLIFKPFDMHKIKETVTIALLSKNNN